MNYDFSFYTGTSTLAIFDLEAIKHRLFDTPDWWSIPEEEIQEINLGNIIFLNFDSDGVYNVNVSNNNITNPDGSLFINIPSGKVFIGAGDDTTGGELEPDETENTSGRFLKLNTGYYMVSFKKDNDNICISFISSDMKDNNLSTPVKI